MKKVITAKQQTILASDCKIEFIYASKSTKDEIHILCEKRSRHFWQHLGSSEKNYFYNNGESFSEALELHANTIYGNYSVYQFNSTEEFRAWLKNNL